jgi:hypothetical protein
MLFAPGRGEIVRGESYDAGGRRLTPIARVRTRVAASGRFESLAVDPVGVIEEVGGSLRLIAIGWGWRRRAGFLALLGLPVLVFVVASSLAGAARRSRRARRRR